jgi:hypothetical protein
MILHAVDQNGLAADILKDARHVAMQAHAEVRIVEKRSPVFGTENEMQDYAGEGLWHDRGD